jgi:hypothetical protein
MIDKACAVMCAAALAVAAGGSVHAQQSAAARLAGLSREIACAPVMASSAATGPLKITSGRDLRKTLFGVGDKVIVGGGTAQGLKVGDEYFVRRIDPDRYAAPIRGAFPLNVHTAGAVQISEATTDGAVAVITYSCDGISEGDFLERFDPPPLPRESVGTTPDYANPGRLILGSERRSISGAGDFMIVDRGSDHGLRVGQMLTIFRPTVGGAGPVTQVATARVYAVKPESSTVRIESSMDAVHVGDLVAIHR